MDKTNNGNNNTELTGWKKFCKEQNIEITFKRIFIDGMGGMAHGLFASLLIGCIIGTISNYLVIPCAETIGSGSGNFLAEVKNFCYAVQGAAMAGAIAFSMKSPNFVIYSCLAVGYAANQLGGGGGPLAVFFVTVFSVFLGKLVSKRTPVDIIVTPAVTIIGGVAIASLIAPPIGKIATLLGELIMTATNLQPFLMGIVCAVLMGIVLTLPISSAAICAALGLVGLAGGASVAGCCAQMVGFAVISYSDNGIGGLLSQGLGTSMLQVPNLLKKPVLWIPPCVAAAVGGVLSTCVFKLQMNGAPISSGMGTSGLVGPIGVITGWSNTLADMNIAADKALQFGVDVEAYANNPTLQWIGLIVCAIVVPALVSWGVATLMRRAGLIKEGDLKIEC